MASWSSLLLLSFAQSDHVENTPQTSSSLAYLFEGDSDFLSAYSLGHEDSFDTSSIPCLSLSSPCVQKTWLLDNLIELRGRKEVQERIVDKTSLLGKKNTNSWATTTRVKPFSSLAACYAAGRPAPPENPEEGRASVFFYVGIHI